MNMINSIFLASTNLKYPDRGNPKINLENILVIAQKFKLGEIVKMTEDSIKEFENKEK